MPEPRVILVADGLLSKWGFNDGDMPDDVWDYCDEQGLSVNWHDVLALLVRRHLVPKLDQAVEVVEIGTNHNPIRAESVDGADVTDEWYGDDSTRLTPDSVTITFEQLRAAIGDVIPIDPEGAE